MNKFQFSIFKFLLFLLFLPNIIFAQYSDHRNRQVDSLEHVLTTNMPTGRDLAVIYYNLMKGYQQINMEKSMDYARKCISESICIDEWTAVSAGYSMLGMHHWAMSQYDSAEVYYRKGLEAAEQMRNFPKKYEEKQIDDRQSSILGNMGNLFNSQGKYHEAIYFYTRALKIFEKYDYKESQSIAYYSIGEMFMAMENFQQAEINFIKLDSLAQITGVELHIAYAKEKLSALYLVTKEYSKSLQNAEIAYDYFFSNLSEEGARIVSTLNLLSHIYLEGYKDEIKSEKYLQQALQILDTLNIHREKSISLRLLSVLYLNRGQWRNAEQTALKALETDDSEPANTLALYETLSKVYGKIGNIDKSWEYFDKHNELQSSWATKHYQSAIREMEIKYETEKKETAIASLETENRLLVSQKQLLMWMGIISIVTLLLIMAVLFFFWRFTLQKRQTAETRILQLEQEKQLIATQSVLDGETAERTRLARDLHDGLGSLLTGAKMHFFEIKQHVKLETENMERFGLALGLLEQSINEMRRVAHHLMPDSLSRFGLNGAVSDFCSQLPSVEYIYYGDNSRLDAKLEMMIYSCIYELVNNALKHSGAQNIIVQIMQRTDSISFAVQDDGCGFDTSIVPKGTGLQNIKTRVATYNGIINIDSKENEGTEVNVELKILGQAKHQSGAKN